MSKLSPTQVKLFRLCMRKWAFAYIEKIKAPSTAKQQFGTGVHSKLEVWLSKGTPMDDTPEGKVAKQGVRPGWLPTPSPKLVIEQKLQIDLTGMVDGVTLVGFADCAVPPGYEGVVEPIVIDHKSTGDLKWAMKPDELSEDPQAVIYAYWAMRKWKVRRVRVRWVYYAATNPDKGPRKPAGAKMVEWLFDMDTVLWQRTFEKLLNDLAAMRDALLTWESAEAATPNPRGCGVYGGCPYALKCNLQPADVLATAIMQDGREHYGLRLTPQCDTTTAPDAAEAAVIEEPAMTMSLIDKLKQMKAQNAAAEAAPETPQEAPQEEPQTAPEAAPEPAPTETPDPTRETLLAKLRTMGDSKAVNPEPAPAPEPEPEPEPEQEGDGLDALLKADLASRMQARGVPVPAGWTKARLIAWLRANPDNGVAAPEVDEQKPAERGVVLKATDPDAAKAAAIAKADERIAAVMKREAELKAEADAKAEAMYPEAMPVNPVTGGFVVMFDAVYAKNATIANGVKHLGDVVKPIADIVAKDNGVEHWGLVEFHRGGPMLAAKFERYLDAAPLDGVILADSRTAEARALRDVLIRRAGVVVQGIA